MNKDDAGLTHGDTHSPKEHSGRILADDGDLSVQVVILNVSLEQDIQFRRINDDNILEPLFSPSFKFVIPVRELEEAHV